MSVNFSRPCRLQSWGGKARCVLDERFFLVKWCSLSSVSACLDASSWGGKVRCFLGEGSEFQRGGDDGQNFGFELRTVTAFGN
eukprot:3041822-Rhodomonas_salina.1